MYITAGLGNADDYEAYVRAGADELFSGYVPYEWQKKHELMYPLNRREVSFVNVNIGSFSEMEILADKVNIHKVPVSIAFNALYYDPALYPEITGIMERLFQLGFKDVIAADPGLIYYLSRRGMTEKMNVHVSGEYGEINIYQIRMLKKLGVRRIIYHRGTSLDEIKEMTAEFPDLEHEVFFMNENCHFTGAYCNSAHCDELVPVCRMPYVLKGRSDASMNVNPRVRNKTENLDENDADDFQLLDGCGLCYLKELSKIKVSHLKIVGRGAGTDHMISSISLAKRALDLSRRIDDPETFREMVKNNIMGKSCRGKCYYRSC